MVDWERFNEERNKVIGEIKALLQKMWDEGTCTIREYKELEDKKRKVEKEFDKRKYGLQFQEEKEKIACLRRGSLLLVRGNFVSQTNDRFAGELAAAKVKLLRKGAKNATVEVLEGALQGRKFYVHYMWLVPWTEESKKRMEEEKKMNEILVQATQA